MTNYDAENHTDSLVPKGGPVSFPAGTLMAGDIVQLRPVGGHTVVRVIRGIQIPPTDQAVKP